MDAVLSRLRVRIPIVREVFAEFLGTFVLLFVGITSVAQAVLSDGKSGTMLSINLSWGIAVAMGIFIAGGVSGAHLNPAVTVALATLGKFSWVKVLPYIIAQYIGAFIGAACAYWVYLDAIGKMGMMVPETAGIFATFPKEYLSNGNAFVDQIMGTGILMMGILAIVDPYNMSVPKYAIPLGVGSLVGVIGMALGHNCGYAINPARDLSPRLFTLAAGWGKETFEYQNHYWWIPILGPHLGAIMGGWLYQLLVGVHWPLLDEEEKSKTETQF
uniref:Aquaglyceroporin-3 n=1 Tax=Strigamia maritima TaxID=126957 RepID=T1IUC1_STRMM